MFRNGRVAAAVAVGLVLVAGGCGSEADERSSTADDGVAQPTPTRQPSGELVEWVGDLCESTSALHTIRKDSSADLKKIRKTDEDHLHAVSLSVSYLSQTPSAVKDVERDLRDLDPSGVRVADRLVDSWLKTLKGVRPELDKVSPSTAVDDPEGSAAKLDKLVQSLTTPQPELPALTKKDPQLAAAHKRAKQCAPGWKPAKKTPAPEPSGPLPKAADGKNTGACADGTCEILVTSPVNVTANGLDVDIDVSDDAVTFRTSSTLMELGGSSGVAEFGDDLMVVIIARDKDGAVLNFSTP